MAQWNATMVGLAVEYIAKYNPVWAAAYYALTTTTTAPPLSTTAGPPRRISSQDSSEKQESSNDHLKNVIPPYNLWKDLLRRLVDDEPGIDADFKRRMLQWMKGFGARAGKPT